MRKCRLYIDESGTHNYVNSPTIGQRYLALLGVAIAYDHYEEVLKPKFRDLKAPFEEDPDEVVILHREDIVSKKGPFEKLDDDAFRKEFNSRLFDIIDNCNYVVFCVVLDKREHLLRYGDAAYHPYHYCLELLLERYCLFLKDYGLVGDVMAESRGKKEDTALRRAYTEFYDIGTPFCPLKCIRERISSKRIKIKPKSAGIAGLELADILALAGKLDTLRLYGILPRLDKNFLYDIVLKLRLKYRRAHVAPYRVKGYGLKLIE